MKKILMVIGLFLLSKISFGQQELQMSHYLFNGFYWNPGYTGSNDYTRFTAMYRHQWTTISGAPRTGMFSADIPLINDNMGLGLQVVSDHIGVSSLNEIFATYAYHVRFNKKIALGLGVRAGISYYNARLKDLLVWDNDDTEFDNNVRSVMIPKFGFGAYLHGENFYLGASIPTLWVYDKDYDFNVDIDKSSWWRRHYFISGAYAFKIKDYMIKPSFLTKYVVNAPFQADLSVTGGIKDIVFVTLGYRTNAAAIAMIEVRPIETLRIAYAFDLSTPDYLRVYGGTTHEIMLGYDILMKNARYKSPRYF